MAKEVILLDTVPDLGMEGDVVKVADGYARNYLMPRKLAAPVTAVTQKRLDKLRELRAAREAAMLNEAKELAAKIEAASITMPVQTGEGDRMFGAVTAADILHAAEENGIHLDKRQLKLKDNIHELGVFSVDVQVHPEVKASLKIWVVGE